MTAVQCTLGAVWLLEIKDRADPSMSRVQYFAEMAAVQLSAEKDSTTLYNELKYNTIH